MPTFTGKTFSSFYKNILGIDQSSNTGVDSSVRTVQDGAGNNSVIGISDDNLFVKPINDNTTETFNVFTKDSNQVFRVDTTDSKVLVGASQTSANTQYQTFGILGSIGSWSTAVADTHYAVPFGGMPGVTTTIGSYAMGSSTSSSFNDTNPATSLTISATAMDIVTTYWYVMDDITIDAVKWFHGADDATGDTTAAHLMAYTVDIANGSTSGDLSSGTVVAGYDATGGGGDSTKITNAGYEQIYYQQLPIVSADVDAGKVILFTFASDTVNSDYSINATVKYHIR